MVKKMGMQRKSKKLFITSTTLVIIALASILSVYAGLVATYSGTGVEIIDDNLNNFATVKYTLDNSTWETTTAPDNPGDDWFARVEFIEGGYSGPATLTWTLENETITPGAYVAVEGATFTSGTIVLTGEIQTLYATADGTLTIDNVNWGSYVLQSGTYRVTVVVNTA